MKPLTTLFLACLLVCAMVGSVALALPAAGDEPRVALVVGNADYAVSPLLTPRKDAKAMAAKLEELGFEVILKENADQRALMSGLREFGDRLRGEGGVGLFYYAGHGVQVDGKNYLIPVGIDVHREYEVKYQALNLDQVMEEMGHARNRVNLVIVDACRNNPFASRFRSLSSGLAAPSSQDTPTGTFIAFATAPGRVAHDGQENGIYTKHLLQHIGQPGVPVEQVFKQVRIQVMEETDRLQIPWENSSLTGDFFFRPAIAPAPGRIDAQQTLVDEHLRPNHAGLVAWAREALKADPEDTDARQSLETVIGSYVDWSAHYLDNGELDKAMIMLLRARTLADHAQPDQLRRIELLAASIGGRYLRTAEADWE